ncbi:MAG: NADH-quinone oxidoreductase subunit NuoB [Lachnospiraceae bacterium]|nr:NADH-quinone oxidoreductase subunit NuoB [Lachnospiraceae bacterium]MDD7178367.1 NADH-quinone oxidoreductase subunit NuoB [bacterium]MDY5516046.1 NADH-quinone oxidoreductase subunit NuoB [Lachnospiraceae bacterium]
MANVSRSPWLLHYDGSSCNGCDIEVLACLTPVYDAERFGVVNTGNPMHADILLITGGINSQNASVVEQIYNQMPNPKVVCAVGTCACTGGVFKECYNIRGGADTVIPVDIYVPGCAARPQSIIDGIVQAVALFQKKHEEMKNEKK